MGARRLRAADRAGRPAMRSPGRPPVGRREHRQWFWLAIAEGMSSEDAGVAAGVSPAVGSRWFREGGGMPTTAPSRCRGATCPSPSGRRSPSSVPRTPACVRSDGGWDGPPQPSRGSCAATRRLAAVFSSTGRRPRSGTLTGERSAPRSRSSPPTSGSETTCRNAWRVGSRGPTARQCRVRTCGGSVAGTGVARIAGGRTRGVRSRSGAGQEVRRSRDHDQRTARRGGRPCRARTLGR